MIFFQVYVFVQGDTLGVQWLGEDLVLFWRVSIRSFFQKEYMFANIVRR